MTEVGVLEARNNLSHLIKLAKAGETVVITSRRQPQVRLVPVYPTARGSAAAVLAAVDAAPPARHTHDLVEAMISAERESWE